MPPVTTSPVVTKSTARSLLKSVPMAATLAATPLRPVDSVTSVNVPLPLLRHMTLPPLVFSAVGMRSEQYGGVVVKRHSPFRAAIGKEDVRQPVRIVVDETRARTDQVIRLISTRTS